MSEYQYYEFLAVDRPLDERQLGELRALSTRASLTPTSLVNTYHWGDFRGDPRTLMEKYFDAFLYLAWLLCAQAGELDDDVVEPPVPPDLGTLTGPLCSVAAFLRINDDLFTVAAEASEQSAPDDRSSADLVRWIENLPVAEKNALLVRVACGDDACLRVELLRRFRGQYTDRGEAVAGSRTVGELLGAAQTRREQRERLKAQQQAQERAAGSAQQRSLGKSIWIRWQPTKSMPGTG